MNLYIKFFFKKLWYAANYVSAVSFDVSFSVVLLIYFIAWNLACATETPLIHASYILDQTELGRFVVEALPREHSAALLSLKILDAWRRQPRGAPCFVLTRTLDSTAKAISFRQNYTRSG